jgi:hypothetical protein
MNNIWKWILSLFTKPKPPAPPKPPVDPPPPEWKPIAIVVYGNNGQPLAGATVKLDGNPHVYPKTNSDGYTIVDVLRQLG